VLTARRLSAGSRVGERVRLLKVSWLPGGVALDDKGNDFYADVTVTAPKASLLTIGSPPS
jgi:hypothetical protein